MDNSEALQIAQNPAHPEYHLAVGTILGPILANLFTPEVLTILITALMSIFQKKQSTEKSSS